MLIIFLKALKNEDNLILLDNVLINNIYEAIFNITRIEQFKSELKLFSSSDVSDYFIIMIHIYKIFLYNFILYLTIFDTKLYKLDKHVKDDGTTIFNITQLELAPHTPSEKMRNNFTNSDDTLQYNRYIRFKKVVSSDGILFDHFYSALEIDDIANNIYKIYKTNRNEFIIVDINHVTNDDLETLCRLNNCKLHINNKFNLPEFIGKNDERLKKYLSKQYEYPQYDPDNTGKLSNLKDNGTFNFFDKISTFYDKYISLQQSQTTGGNNNKYNICTNKKTNYAYIIYNKKKSYFYKNENKIYIKLANNNFYINKKILSYDSNSNSYFIIIR